VRWVVETWEEGSVGAVLDVMPQATGSGMLSLFFNEYPFSS